VTQRPHLRREVVLSGPTGEVYAWACRTLDCVGFGQHWKTAHDMWILARATPWSPGDWREVMDSSLFPSAHTDRTLQ
jgi:hypothetical protein